MSLLQTGLQTYWGKGILSFVSEGEKDNIHISIVGGRVILVVIFDEWSSLGLVRLRVKECSEELNRIFNQIVEKSEKEQAKGGAFFDSPFAEITDEDIDALFKD